MDYDRQTKVAIRAMRNAASLAEQGKTAEAYSLGSDALALLEAIHEHTALTASMGAVSTTMSRLTGKLHGEEWGT